MTTIGVFFGSRNPEHDVSIITGQMIMAGLRKLGYEVVPVYLTKSGVWNIGTELGKLKTFTKTGGASTLNDVDNWYLDLELSTKKRKFVFRKKGIIGKNITVDLAFPAFHGQNGEDGTFQGLCELLNVPYVGCDVMSSAITMDKVMTKLLYVAQNIPTTEFVYFTKYDYNVSKANILSGIKEKLLFPVVVKPARLGSSIGIAKAKDQKEMEFAIEVALQYDDKALVEECVEPLMDVTCAILGNNEPAASLLQESVFSSDFFSYDDKYLNDGGAQLGRAKNKLMIPATLDQKTTKAIRDMAVAIYKMVGCSGTARVDFLYNKKTKKYYANEINTLPGTLYHHLWKASGIELPELLTKLVKLAEERYVNKQKITATFESDILKQADSAKLKMKG